MTLIVLFVYIRLMGKESPNQGDQFDGSLLEA